MRFILNFFLFGFLFYLIYVFFPDAFNTLVSWANHVYEFIKTYAVELMQKFNSHPSTGTGEAPKALLFFLMGNRNLFK